MAFLAGQKVTAAALNALSIGYQTYAPANTNITVGNGTQTARYRRQGNEVTVIYTLVFGTTTAISSVARIGLPVAVAGSDAVASIRLSDTSASTHQVGLSAAVAGNSDIALIAANGNVVSNTVPWAWANGDSIRMTIIYEAA